MVVSNPDYLSLMSTKMAVIEMCFFVCVTINQEIWDYMTK